MATTTLSPTPVFKAFDNNGNPLFNGQLFTYAAGTSSPQTTYTDSTGNTANTNPIILNSRGECNLWLNPAQAYKFLLEDAAGNSIWSVDNVTAPIIQIPYAAASGTNTITVNTTPSFGTVQDGLLLYFKAANTTTGAATLNANSTGAYNLYYADGVTQIVPGAIIQNNIYAAVFDSSLNSSAGGYIIQNPSPVSASYTGTPTGLTTAPTGTINVSITSDAKICSLTIPGGIFIGTSNATSMTITGGLSFIAPTSLQAVLALMRDNSTDGNNGVISIAASATTLTLGKSNVYAIGGFTSTGLKGFNPTVSTVFTFSYPLRP